MSAVTTGKFITQSARMQKAILLFDNVDKRFRLRAVFAIIAFFFSCGLGFRSFFWLIDLTTWLGLEKVHITGPSLVSFILIFVVTILVFACLISLIDALVLGDIIDDTGHRLSALTLNENERQELLGAVRSDNWKQGQVIRSMITKLTDGQTHP